MVPDQSEKPRVTEIQVRMDCNGCIQKIKKAIGGIHGICDLYFDFLQQKITIVGWADPEDIVRAIRKTRKTVTICSHTEKTQQPPPQPAEEQIPPPENEESVPETSQSPQADQTQTPETTAPTDQRPPDQPPPEKPPEEEAAPPQQAVVQPETPTESTAQQQPQSGTASMEAGEAHDNRHDDNGQYWSKYPNDQPFRLPYEPPPYYAPPRIGHRHGCDYSHGFHGHWSNYSSQPFPFPYEPPPPSAYVTHCYNSYRPSTYVTEYEYMRSTPTYTYYGRQEHYSEDYRNGNGSITSMFSDENPNACNIV